MSDIVKTWGDVEREILSHGPLVGVEFLNHQNLQRAKDEPYDDLLGSADRVQLVMADGTRVCFSPEGAESDGISIHIS